MEVQEVCRWCKREVKLTVSRKGWFRWKTGTHIQDALPELSAGERELLISKTCEPCFDKMFGEEG